MIIWDVSALESMKSDITKNRNEMDTLKNELTTQRSELSSAWRSESGEIADKRLESEVKMLEWVSSEITEHIAALNYAVEQYTNCENSVLNKVRSAGNGS